MLDSLSPGAIPNPADLPMRRARSRHLNDLNIDDVVSALSRRWLLIACLTAIFTLVGVAATLLLPPSFVAEGFLVVDARRSSIPEIGVVSVQPADPRIPRSEAKVLVAPEFMEALSSRLQLQNLPQVISQVSAKDAERLDIAGLSDTEERLHAARKIAAVDWLAHHFSAKGEDRSYAITVTADTPDANLSARIVNEAMALYLERRNQDDGLLMARASASVSARFDDIRREVADLEARILAERKQLDLVSTNAGRVEALDLVKSVDEVRLNDGKLAELRAARAHALTAARTGQWQNIDSSVASPNLLKLLERETDAARRYAEALTNFGPRHPDVLKATREVEIVHQRLKEETNRIASSLSNEIAALEERQATLTKEIEEGRQSSVEAEQKLERIRQLEDELKSKRQLFAEYDTRMQQLAASVGAAAGAVRVGAWATPPIAPAGPSSLLLVALSGLVGSMVGILYVVLERRFGDRLESADEIVAVANLPVLGAVPEIKSRFRTSKLVWSRVVRDPHGIVAESIRALLVRVQFALKDNQGVILITSPRAGDGKTSVSLAMAELATMSGRRVLLVDADLYRGGVTRAAGLSRPDAASMDPASTVVEDDRSGLHILPAVRADSVLQQNKALERLMGAIVDARAGYDLVIVDTPPIMHVSDAALLAPHADAIVLVASWQRASRRALIEALDRIEASGRPISGIALSKVPRTARQTYLYSGYTRGPRPSKRTGLRSAIAMGHPSNDERLDWEEAFDKPVIHVRARQAPSCSPPRGQARARLAGEPLQSSSLE